jgi:hypothetical protein
MFFAGGFCLERSSSNEVRSFGIYSRTGVGFVLRQARTGSVTAEAGDREEPIDIG